MAPITHLTLLTLFSTLALSSPQTRRLQARQDAASTPSNAPAVSDCQMSPADPSISYRNTGGSLPYIVTVDIANKTTTETGAPGQGLKDNISGECGIIVLNDSVFPEGATASGKSPNGQLEWYTLQVALADADTGCVQRAIWDAENQNVVCEVQGGSSSQ